ncbi:excinuclease ABC subunit UvrB [Patescibacteria group bacterium]|nr:excinuclease ABC subunit UvrB [Patescibacteria group bacterium]
MQFKLKSPYRPAGDQPRAIKELTQNLQNQTHNQVLLGVTGSGKTYVMANIIKNIQKPTLIISHNKTLAAQLASEMREFFPHNAVNYFVSYYDYYQPEAYMPTTDTYIEKDASINEEIDRLRNAATYSLLTRPDTIIVASVSCIYGLGDPKQYEKSHLHLAGGKKLNQKNILEKLIEMRYMRHDFDLARGRFRVRGENLDIFPSYGYSAFRITFFGDMIEKIVEIDPLTGVVIKKIAELDLFPATHFITPPQDFQKIEKKIKKDLQIQLTKFKKKNKLLEAQRLKERIKYDLEMIKETGYCNGIENYSLYFDGRSSGEPPSTLLSYFPKNYLLIIDESHMTIPQIGGMYNGDRARKDTLVEFGFRLPTAKDNRPLRFDEFKEQMPPTIYVSATPGEYEIKKSRDKIIELIVRPTGLVDPEIEIRPAEDQIKNLIPEIEKRVKNKQRVLVTTITKRLAEEISEFLKNKGIKVAYLHSDIKTLERLDILKNLRQGKYDVLVGINLLREGLDLPEVSLVAILDADKEGFLRSDWALIQTMGRAARNIDGRAILYADNITGSIKRARDETNRRRKIQLKYNRKHHITPKSITKKIKDQRFQFTGSHVETFEALEKKKLLKSIPADEKKRLIKELKEKMELSARNLEFEKATILRDQIKELGKGRTLS